MSFSSSLDFEALFKSIPGLFLVLTPDFNIIAVSDSHLQATMTKREEVLGRNVFDVFPDNPNDPNATGSKSLRASLDKVLKDRVADTMAVLKYDIRRPGSEEFEERFWIPVNSPVFNTENELVYIINRVEDVTEFVRLRKASVQMEAEIFLRTQQVAQSNRLLQETNLELARLNDQLEQANKDLGAFSYSISHDLRAPLRAIQGFSTILKAEHGDKIGEEGHRLLDVVCDNAKRMGQLIDDLLAFSRFGRQAFNFSFVDVAGLFQDVFNELKGNNPERQIQLKMETLEPIWGDLALLRQVCMNLLSNAVKYSKGKTVAVITIQCQQGENEVIYEISDNGAGFDMQYVGKLFGVFQRLHNNEFEGTGVGLAIVQQIVRRHGGRVWAKGEIGHGASFYMAFPKISTSQK